MTLRSINHIVVPSLAIVGACSAAVLFFTMHLRHDRAVENGTGATALAVAPPESDARRDGVSGALLAAQAEAGAATPTLPLGSQEKNVSAPSFDVARVDRMGDAVIAGRATPGSIVELLLNGERHDQGVSDQSGEFIIIPPRLPRGQYELTLRSRTPDGKQITSRGNVAVALGDVDYDSDVLNSRAEMPWEGVRFAAMSLTKDQGARVIVSNVLVPENGAHLLPCQVQVNFFGADGLPIGDPTTVQLKAGESTSVPAVHPSKLVRAIVSIDDVIDSSKVCTLKTRVEIFDVQTDITFVSVSGEAFGSNNECGVSTAGAPGAVRKTIAGRKNSSSVATSSSPAPKIRSPELADTQSTAPR
jgi:hypothetical protein